MSVMFTVLLKGCDFLNLNLNFNVSSISNKSFADTINDITGLPIPMPMTCQEQE
jgi:hypothetical protein